MAWPLFMLRCFRPLLGKMAGWEDEKFARQLQYRTAPSATLPPVRARARSSRGAFSGPRSFRLEEIPHRLLSADLGSCVPAALRRVARGGFLE